MSMNPGILLSTILCLFICMCQIHAQDTTTGSITGRVAGPNGDALETVTVILLNQADSSYVGGTITNENGSFMLEDVAEGSYLLEPSMLGYHKQYTAVHVATGQSVQLETLYLQEDTHLLSTVTVTANKRYIEMEAGKTTVNLSSSIIGSEGTLVETLKSLPGLVIREDGTILLNGQSGATVLINDKETYLSGENLLAYLRAIPANTVDNVELITHPSARYDAAGSAGKINIKMKKARLEGLTLPVSGSYQQGKNGKGHLGFNMNLKKEKITFYSTYSYHQGIDESDTDIERTSMDYSSMDITGQSESFYVPQNKR